MNLHMVIAINRLWALFAPTSYRNCTKRTALAIVVMNLVFIHLVCLPGLIAESLHYEQDPGECYIHVRVSNGLNAWSIAVTVVIFCLPIVFMIVAAVAVWVRERSLMHQHHTGLRLLMVLTVSVCVCWIPYELYYVQYRITGYQNLLVNYLLSTLYNVQAILDPLLIVYSMPSFRAAVACAFRRKRNSVADQGIQLLSRHRTSTF
ncbi:substance-K receptor-like [Paramacrobiotus metropolitanus]|uniref:substance-K receptor-like n=1 Tax=Paramacrobiotus metropolitanus TaxID=2943436 RepID=UPI002445B3C2|nr:substance-K receptor-like [Paramacrobiotus metropolitanus]